MADGDSLHPLQQKFLEHAALQCGICTPGVVIAAKALLEHNPDPTEEQARYWLAGNLCRCTGYDKIIRAVLDAADTAVWAIDRDPDAVRRGELLREEYGDRLTLLRGCFSDMSRFGMRRILFSSCVIMIDIGCSCEPSNTSDVCSEPTAMGAHVKSILDRNYQAIVNAHHQTAPVRSDDERSGSPRNSCSGWPCRARGHSAAAPKKIYGG